MPPTRDATTGVFARHRLEVDDAERLVDGRTDEDCGVRVERDDTVLRQHLANPDDAVWRVGAGTLDRLGHFAPDFRSVGRAGAEHDLRAGVDVL
jgi:hypothetical protein